MSANEVGKAFVEHYYNTFDVDRKNLTSLYRPESMLSFEGQQHQGPESIIGKLSSLPFQKCRHQIVTMDCQPLPGLNGILVFVCGNLLIDEEQNAMKYSQVFTLIPSGNTFFVLNDCFRLNIG